jgi:hypothetical protein
MSTRFNSITGKKASKRRKTRYPPITHKYVGKKKDLGNLKGNTKAIVESWRNNLYSGGSNNSIGFAGLKRVIEQMHLPKPFRRNSGLC